MMRTVVRVVVTAMVLPHEVAHALPAVLAGLSVEVSVLPEWEGPQVVLGRFNAGLRADTPLWLIRLIAVSPLIVHLGTAAVVGAVLSPTSAAVLPALLAVSFWASLSGGDLAVAANPGAAREAGEFLVPGSRWQRLSLPLVPVTVLAVTALILR